MAVTESISKRRTYDGPAIFERGFRPFFFLAGIWAIIPLTLWVLTYLGTITPLGDINAQAWHSHEMIFGYAGAALAGFALTAIPNWTGRLPVRGTRLMLLVLLWLVARSLTASTLFFDVSLYAFVFEALFFIVFSALVFREILVGKNWRNMPVAIIFSLFGLVAIFSSLSNMELISSSFNFDRAAIATLVLLISLIGGRIVPSFTQNWLKQQGAKELPIAFNRQDGIILVISAVTLVCWLTLPYNNFIVWATALPCALLHVWRLSRWCGLATFSEPLVAMLHVAYLWIAIGFAMVALATLDMVSESTAVHAWTTGAIASMTLAVMMRASLGHSGRALKADKPTIAIFSLITLAAITRLIAATLGSTELITISAALWIVGYVVYVAAYTPIFWNLKK